MEEACGRWLSVVMYLASKITLYENCNLALLFFQVTGTPSGINVRCGRGVSCMKILYIRGKNTVYYALTLKNIFSAGTWILSAKFL